MPKMEQHVCDKCYRLVNFFIPVDGKYYCLACFALPRKKRAPIPPTAPLKKMMKRNPNDLKACQDAYLKRLQGQLDQSCLLTSLTDVRTYAVNNAYGDPRSWDWETYENERLMKKRLVLVNEDTGGVEDEH